MDNYDYNRNIKLLYTDTYQEYSLQLRIVSSTELTSEMEKMINIKWNEIKEGFKMILEGGTPCKK